MISAGYGGTLFGVYLGVDGDFAVSADAEYCLRLCDIELFQDR